MSEPRPYDIENNEERQRLIREVTGYMQISRRHGTDRPGREYAYEAMVALWKGIERGEFAVVRIVEREPAPFVFDEDAL